MIALTVVQRVTRALDSCGFLAEAIGIANAHHVPIDWMLGRDRTKSASNARRALYQTMYERGLSYPEIGKIVERDPSTIMFALRPRGGRKAGPVVHVRVAEAS